MSQLILLLCGVTVIQVTSSQPTYDVTDQNQVNSISRTGQSLHQLMTVLSQLLQNAVDRSQRTDQTLDQLATAVSQIYQNNLNSSSLSDQKLSILMAVSSQQQAAMSQIETAVSRVDAVVSQLSQNEANSSSLAEQGLHQLMTVMSQNGNRTDVVLNQVMAMNSQQRSSTSQLQAAVSQIGAAVSQLQQADANSCTDQMLSQLMTAVSQIKDNDQALNQQMTTVNSNLMASSSQQQLAMSQLQEAVSQNDANSSSRADQMLHQLIAINTHLVTVSSQQHAAMSQLQTTVSQIGSAVSEMASAMSQLQSTNFKLQSDVAALKAAAAIHENVTECPDDFTYIASVNGCYKVLTRKLDWSAAGLQCRSLHEAAHLLVIGDAREQSAVAEMLSSANHAIRSGCQNGRDMIFWTAGQRIVPNTGSSFVWRLTSTDTYSDAISVMRYTNWNPREPNNNHEGCLELSSARSYRWNDRRCSENLCPVCELDIISSR